MKNILLIILIAVLFACASKSKSDLILGEWKIVSWITKNKHTNNKEKEMIGREGFSISVIFKKDSLQIVEKNKIETYEYYLSNDTITIPKDALGGMYLIKQLITTELDLYEHKTFRMQDGEVIESTSMIKF